MWIQLAQTVVMAIAAVVIWIAYRAFAVGQWVQAVDHTKELTAIAARLDRAGEEMSDLTTKIQRLPEELRMTFVTKELFTEFRVSTERDRTWLFGEVEKLWSASRRRDESRP